MQPPSKSPRACSSTPCSGQAKGHPLYSVLQALSPKLAERCGPGGALLDFKTEDAIFGDLSEFLGIGDGTLSPSGLGNLDDWNFAAAQELRQSPGWSHALSMLPPVTSFNPHSPASPGMRWAPTPGTARLTTGWPPGLGALPTFRGLAHDGHEGGHHPTAAAVPHIPSGLGDAPPAPINFRALQMVMDMVQARAAPSDAALVQAAPLAAPECLHPSFPAVPGLAPPILRPDTPVASPSPVAAFEAALDVFLRQRAAPLRAWGPLDTALLPVEQLAAPPHLELGPAPPPPLVLQDSRLTSHTMPSSASAASSSHDESSTQDESRPRARSAHGLQAIGMHAESAPLCGHRHPKRGSEGRVAPPRLTRQRVQRCNSAPHVDARLGAAAEAALAASEGGPASAGAPPSSCRKSLRVLHMPARLRGLSNADSASWGELGTARSSRSCSPLRQALGGASSSPFRGVSKHRLTQRWEASLWLAGKQLYLGGFETEEDAAHAYDVAALACKGPDVHTNFAAAQYAADLAEVAAYSKEEVVAWVRRRSSAFSRGRSRFRGVSGDAGRWEARIGTFSGRKNVSFGIHTSEEAAARQYDRALIVEKGRAAKTNFPLADYDEEVAAYEAMLLAECGAKDGPATAHLMATTLLPLSEGTSAESLPAQYGPPKNKGGRPRNSAASVISAEALRAALRRTSAVKGQGRH